MIPRIIMSIALAVAFAGPAVAQSYSASYGTGNVIDVPLLEKQTAAMAMAEQLLHCLRRARQKRHFSLCLFPDSARLDRSSPAHSR